MYIWIFNNSVNIWRDYESAALIMANDTISMSTLAAYYISGIPYDIIHAASTVIFLIVLAKPMLTKLDRVKKKYGLLLKGRNSFN